MPSLIPDVKKLAANQDLYGLINALRYPESAAVRAEAAQALGSLGNDQAVESLARAALEDPSSEVKHAARSALEELYGNVASSILASYQNSPPYSEQWIRPTSDAQIADNLVEPVEAGTPSMHFDIPWLKKSKDMESLIEALRSPDDPAVRVSAAAALGELGRKESAEYLVRSLLEDPDQKVQSAAQQALVEMFGNEASNVIASYRQAPAYTDTWLQQPQTSLPEQFEPIPETAGLTALPTKIALLKDNQDFEALVEIMRSPSDPQQRAEAASALGELGEEATAEFLARAVLEDPEAQVKSNARSALNKILSYSASEGLIASLRSNAPDSDAWLRPTPGLQLEQDGFDPGRVRWSAQDIGGLITVVRAERDPKMKIKAIRMLTKIGDPQAEHVLASMALWFDDALVRQAAWQALESLHGDDAVKVIDAYRRLGLAAGEGDEYSSEADGDEPKPVGRTPENPGSFQSAAPYNRQNQVMKEEGLGLWQALLWIALVVVIGAGIYFFFLVH
ncbi:MAG TPA: HEAT repeat domain-containing protein [Anaerolineaceae bacterium]|nr:HEAT repeat domain-containing protein [Anaerolineaceae bacterium]